MMKLGECVLLRGFSRLYPFGLVYGTFCPSRRAMYKESYATKRNGNLYIEMVNSRRLITSPFKSNGHGHSMVYHESNLSFRI
jgi:hypothetical protein